MLEIKVVSKKNLTVKSSPSMKMKKCLVEVAVGVALEVVARLNFVI